MVNIPLDVVRVDAKITCMVRCCGLSLISYFNAMSLYVNRRQAYKGSKGDLMTNDERREKRYQNRVKMRQEKKRKVMEQYNDFDVVMSYKNLYRAYKHCRKGVAWKESVQSYITQAPLLVYETFVTLQNDKYKPLPFNEFDIKERGHDRHIMSTVIKERVVQNCDCDNALVPASQRSLIHANGASMKNKGYTFHVNLITEHLRHHIRKYGTEGYILIFDFSKFFENIQHWLVKENIGREITDPRLLKLNGQFIDAFGAKGLGLGSQSSQISSVAAPNRLDHYIKEVFGIKGYARYMDDGYLISHSKSYLKRCLVEIERICDELGFKLNKKKTHIVKLSHGFTWLKIRFFITKTGKVIRKICKASITRQRRKLKKLRRKLDEGKLTFKDIQQSFQSWLAYANNFNAYYTIKNMKALYKDLFFEEIFNEVYGIAC